MDTNRLDTFLHTCLRRTLKVHWPMRVLNDEEKIGNKKDQYASTMQVLNIDRSRSTDGTKPKPTCGTDLGTKWEKETRRAEEDLEENSGKRTR